MELLHSSCSKYTLDLTNMYAFALRPAALVLVHTYHDQSNHLYIFHTVHNYSKAIATCWLYSKIPEVMFLIQYENKYTA